MALSRLVLSQFRSHARTRLSFDTRPVALFGANGAGKTNVLEAISLLSPGRGIRRATPDEMARQPEAIGWKVTAEIEGHEIETWAEGSARQVRIDGKSAAQVQLGRIARMIWLVPAMDRLWIEAPEGRRRFLDRIALSFFPAHAEAALDYDRAMRERNRLLRDGIDDPHWLGALEQRMAEAGDSLRAHRVAALERIAGEFPDDPQFPAPALSLETPEPWDNLVETLAHGRRRDMAAGRTLVGPHRDDLAAIYPAKGIAAAQASTGEQKAMLISVVLANARALRDASPIVLLDEVAAHLDPDRRAALYDTICGLGIQAFLTGTEAGLFDQLGARGQRFEVRDEAGQSCLIEVSQ